MPLRCIKLVTRNILDRIPRLTIDLLAALYAIEETWNLLGFWVDMVC